jgi:hypothetical protein
MVLLTQQISATTKKTRSCSSAATCTIRTLLTLATLEGSIARRGVDPSNLSCQEEITAVSGSVTTSVTTCQQKRIANTRVEGPKELGNINVGQACFCHCSLVASRL